MRKGEAVTWWGDRGVIRHLNLRGMGWFLVGTQNGPERSRSSAGTANLNAIKEVVLPGLELGGISGAKSRCLKRPCCSQNQALLSAEQVPSARIIAAPQR